MSAATTTIRVRVDENINAQATAALAAVGLTVPEALRVFLACVAADKGLPGAVRNTLARSVSAGSDSAGKPHQHFPDEPTIDDLCLLC